MAFSPLQGSWRLLIFLVFKAPEIDQLGGRREESGNMKVESGFMLETEVSLLSVLSSAVAAFRDFSRYL